MKIWQKTSILKLLNISLLTCFSIPIFALSSYAETTIERIDRTGVIRAGARKDSKPFGYVDKNGNWVGYGIDMMTVIKSQLQKALKKPLKLELVEVDNNNRFNLIRDNQIDITCGTDSFTWNREQYIDFSLSYFVTGTQLLAKKASQLDSLKDLRSYKIGIKPNTTNEAVLKALDSELNIVPINDSRDAIEKIKKGEIQVYAGDGILLKSLKSELNDQNEWEIIPENDLINRESYACLLPENDSQWRDFVNYSILRAIQGYLLQDPEFTKMFEAWFGATGVVPYSQKVLNNHFQGIVNSVERIPQTAY